MDARPYTPADRAACLAIFESHGLPNRAAFEAFLNDPGDYFVLDHEGEILACGGYALYQDEAHLVWGMVRAASQRQGLGRFLLLYRLHRLSGIATVIAEATPEAAPFFEKQGFRRTSGTQFTKKMNVCS